MIVDNKAGSLRIPIRGLALYVSPIAKGHRRGKTPYIVLNGEADAGTVMNGILRFVQELDDWFGNSLALVPTGRMQDLLTRANQPLKMPLFYTSSSLRKSLFALTADEDALAEQTLSTHHAFKEGELSIADADLNLIEHAAQASGVFFHRFSPEITSDERIFAVGCPISDNYGGGLVAGIVFDGRATALQCWGIGQLAEFLQMNMSLSSSAYGDDELHRALRKLIDGSPDAIGGVISQGRIRAKLPTKMVCGVFGSDKMADERGLDSLQCARIEVSIPDSTAFSNSGMVVAVMPADAAYDEEDRVSDRIKQTALELGEQVGLSDVFENLSDLKSAYIEALRACELASISVPGEPAVAFKDCLIDYMARFGMTELGKQALCGRTFNTLVQHDAGSSVKYLDTLSTYFACSMNLSETADALGIHRSTLSTRLERIGRIAGCDLSEFDECVALYLRLKLHSEKKL